MHKLIGVPRTLVEIVGSKGLSVPENMVFFASAYFIVLNIYKYIYI